jgi:hypothetical protein
MRETFSDSFVPKGDSYSFADNQKRFNDRSKEFLYGQQPVETYFFIGGFYVKDN